MEHLCMLRKWLSSGLHAAHCPDFIDKDSCPPSSPDMNPLDDHVWGRCCRLLSRESAAEGHPGTKVSACEDLGRVTTRRYLQVDREFQEASADGGHFENLLEHCWLIWLIYVCCFCNFESTTVLENVVVNSNCLLILRPCSVEIFALNENPLLFQKYWSK